jgi:hypothetical protein
MNQQNNCEADKQTESLSDLPIADEQANQTKAGAHTPNGRLYLATDAGVF